MADNPEKSIDDVLQEKEDEFHLMMGRSIAIWADIEAQVFQIFRAFLGATTKRAAVVYYRQSTIDARRTLTDELARTVLPQKERSDGGHDHPDTAEWSNISRAMSELVTVRNRIAHQPMRPLFDWDLTDGEVTDPRLWFQIYMSEHEALRKPKEPKPLTKEDLEAHVSSAATLKERLALFRENTLPKYVRPLL